MTVRTRPAKRPGKLAPKGARLLGEGYIWFSSGAHGVGTYTHVCLSTLPSGDPCSTLVQLSPQDLGAWQKVRLWAEPIK